MPCALAAVSDSISDLEAVDGSVFFHYDSRARVPEHCVFTEFCPHLTQGGPRADLEHGIPYCGEVGWILGHRLQNSLLMKAGGFGAAADQRKTGAN